VVRLDVLTAVNQRALAYYGGQPELRGLSPDSLLRRARILHAIGEDEMARGNRRGALISFREAHRTTTSLVGGAPNVPDRIFAHAQSEFWLGYFAFEGRDFTSARSHFEGYKALAGQLLNISSAEVNWLREAAYAESNLCSVELRERNRPAAALRSCAAALERMEQVRSLLPRDPSVIVDLANRHAWLADAWNMSGRWDRVLFHRARQEALVRSLISRDPRNLDYQDIWARTQLTFGELLHERGEHEEAENRLTRAAASFAVLRQRDPDNATWRSLQRRAEMSLRHQNTGEAQ
jgi:hypothetical protein